MEKQAFIWRMEKIVAVQGASMKKRAYAKINLSLDIVGRLENGYHLVDMIMQMIDLYDELTFSVTEDTRIVIETNQKELPLNEDNLIYKAIEAMRKRFHIKQGVKVYLEKRIPIAAGMAGGSSDCAQTLIAVNELFSLGLTKEELREIGVTLGADVAFCIEGISARAQGIGEQLKQVSSMPSCYLVIANPGIFVSTKGVYEDFDKKEAVKHPNVDGMVAALEQSKIEEVAKELGNVLETVTLEQHKEIGALKAFLIEQGALGALMSGSGPTVFGIFQEKEQAIEAKERLQKEKKVFFATVCMPLNQID